MGRVSKILLAGAVVGVVIVVGLSVAVRLYLTDERIKELVIPPTEKVLGRQVSIGEIKVGLLSGIIITDFAVKEKDGKTDFLRSQAFVVEYDLLSVLKKELLVSEIRLESPKVSVVRDKEGVINFSSLKVLEKKESDRKSADQKGTGAAAVLPLALTVDRIKVVNAQLVVRDMKKELPDTDVTANMVVGVQLGSDLASLTYAGDLDMRVRAVYGKRRIESDVVAHFDTTDISYTVDASIDQEKVRLQGKVNHSAKEPDILLDISSQQLNIEYLAALGAAPQAAAKAGNKEAQVDSKPVQIKKPLADSLPPGVLHGKVTIARSTYKKLDIADFALRYVLKKGLLTLNDLNASVAGGSLQSDFKVDFNTVDPAYDGKLAVESLNIVTVGKGLGLGFADVLSGQARTSLDFSGKGFDLPLIKKSLTAHAQYALSNGLIQNTQMTEELARVLQLPELQTIAFEDISGTAELLQGGKVRLASSLSSRDISLETQGTIDLDGNLTLPVVMAVSENMVQKIDKKGLSRYLADSSGQVAVHLNVAGTFQKPVVSFDPAFVKKQVEKAVVNEVVRQLEKALIKKQDGSGAPSGESKPASSDPLQNLLKGFLGQ